MTKVLTLAFSLIFVSSCTGTRPFQSEIPSEQLCVVSDKDDDSCAKNYYRRYDNYDLGFVEISERGNVFNSSHLHDVLDRIESKASNEGVITVVFVHGWLNNAHDKNPNLKKFKGVLESLAAGTKNYGSERRVVGIYVGWRGESLKWPGVRMLTFWNRKSVAQNLGSGAVTRLLLELDRIKRVKVSDSIKDRNVLITVGHSFGGAIVLSAVKDVLLDRLIGSGNGSPVNSIGDEVVLLNPAIEANQVLPLVEVASGKSYSKGQSPIMTIISSDQDGATHKAFPAGQLFGTLALHRQEFLDRNWYVNRNTKQPVKLREEDLDGITIGNYAPFLTHRIKLKSTDNKNDGCTVYETINCADNPHLCQAKGWNRTKNIESLSTLPSHYPLRFIKTDESIIKDHSDIFGSSVSILLRGLIESRLVKKPWSDDGADWSTLSCGQ